MMPETERIAAALEPALREVIDMTMERVAKIEQETMREARELMASAGQNSQEALDHSSRLVNRAEVLTGTVARVTSDLRTEVDDVTASLRGLHGLKAELPQEMVEEQRDAEAEPQHAEADQPEPQPSPDPEPPSDHTADALDGLELDEEEPEPPTPDPEIEPSPELTGMFREQITRMRDDGKPRDEAERVLLRFRLGHRFLGMLDEIYLSGAPTSRARRKRQPFARFRRHV
jgi:hypothetical protein